MDRGAGPGVEDELVPRTLGGAVPFVAGHLAQLECRPAVLAREAESIRIGYRGALGPLPAIRLTAHTPKEHTPASTSLYESRSNRVRPTLAERCSRWGRSAKRGRPGPSPAPATGVGRASNRLVRKRPKLKAAASGS
jgi:hypothetical protein